MILTGKRINWIDWAKGWTIFWVVVFHAFKSVHDTYIFGAEYQFMGEGVIFVIATFIMPVFLHYQVSCIKRFIAFQHTGKR